MKLAREWRFCAYCGHQRRVYTRAHIGVVDFFLSVVLGLLMMLPFAEGIDPRGIGVGVVLSGFAELFVVIRYRLSVRCSKCGFDPIVYRRSPEEAARMVKEFVQAKRESPDSLLAEPVRPYKHRPSKAADNAQHL